MPRGAKLTPEVEDLIVKVCIEHPEWLAKPSKIQQEVIRQLPDSLKTWGGPNWPGIDVIKDRLRKNIRPKLENIPPESKRLDEPWSIGASVEHGIPPEASEDLFDIWRFSLAMDRPISIRQAKWIVHIRNLFHQPILSSALNVLATGNTYSYSDKINRNLWLIRQSWLYSMLERVSRITGEENFDTTNLDAASFMPNWEHATALKLGKVSRFSFPQETLGKLEKSGISLTSPAVSIKSVEQAVWRSVRSEPPRHMERMADGFDDEVLPEEDDLVAAYWLTHLSKGPLWNNLPESPGIREYYESRRRARASGAFVPYSGGFPDDSMYSRQLRVRLKLLEWVKTDSIRRRLLHPVRTGSVIEEVMEAQKADYPGDATPPFNATLLKTVGYAVADKELESWLKLHELELRSLHNGFDHLPADVRERFIRDEQTFQDKEALENADIEQAAKHEAEQKQLDQELLELVAQKGGIPQDPQEAGTFWTSITDEWIEKHRSDFKNELWHLHVYPHPRDLEDEYKRIIEKQKGGTT